MKVQDNVKFEKITAADLKKGDRFRTAGGTGAVYTVTNEPRTIHRVPGVLISCAISWCERDGTGRGVEGTLNVYTLPQDRTLWRERKAVEFERITVADLRKGDRFKTSEEASATLTVKADPKQVPISGRLTISVTWCIADGGGRDGGSAMYDLLPTSPMWREVKAMPQVGDWVRVVKVHARDDKETGVPYWAQVVEIDPPEMSSGVLVRPRPGSASLGWSWRHENVWHVLHGDYEWRAEEEIASSGEDGPKIGDRVRVVNVPCISEATSGVPYVGEVLSTANGKGGFIVTQSDGRFQWLIYPGDYEWPIADEAAEDEVDVKPPAVKHLTQKLSQVQAQYDHLSESIFGKVTIAELDNTIKLLQRYRDRVQNKRSV